jgi:uncharacterized Zn finger protein
MAWDWYPKAKPRRPADGIRAKTGRGQQFGQTWWAGKWLAALQRLVDPGRLSRGRSYARSGQVLNIDIKPGHVSARVQGSRPQPYRVSIEIEPLDEKQWERVTEAMAAQALFAAKLLAGEMPPNIEDAFAAAGVSLFPTRQDDLVTECSCPDWANPCKHVAAVYYLLGERFDEDPFLLFELRGRTKAQIVPALHARRTTIEPVPTSRRKVSVAKAPNKSPRESAPLAASLEHFWDPGTDLETLRFVITAPEVEAAPVKRLGEPAFWSGKPDFTTRLSEAYRTVTAAALELISD